MVARVLARRSELEALLADSNQNSRTQNDIATALSSLDGMLSGDLSNVPHVVVADLNRWLENNKHLAESSLATSSALDSNSDATPDSATATSTDVMNEIVEGTPMVDASNA